MSIFRSESLCATADGHVARLVLTRPDEMNPFDENMHSDFVNALSVISTMPNIRVILLTSTGRAFSAGGDVGMMREVASDRERARRMIDNGYRLFLTVLELRVPLVCAVQGPAMGLGANIAFAADALVAVKTARFADSHVLMGLVAGDGGAVVWPQVGGMMRAKWHLLTGQPITASDAYAAGMITEVVDTVPELEPAAEAIAQRLAGLPPLAVQGTKKAMNQILLGRAREALQVGLMYELDTIGSEDMIEATTAFLDKRSPTFVGR
ncbi:enoyl-CoA hydratase/isomerase family protein [Rhodococcus ruber]|uniref:Enoyl-CoA hydratase/isomerase family protein n=1 Tax=Rhodococcus ruber TaxID=1830 RepID=A0ABT4MEP4_9NOCA|nr:enoyl-CoA hydratase/isomerase family protein [Rhodococcus ruber]MCZ4519465.1 enoyl-CoA hydratase/isomerase family protein [Rhodococcus ruber]